MILELGTTPVVPQIRKWLRGVDLNHRPLGYEPNELPDCSTPQKNHISAMVEGQTDSGGRADGPHEIRPSGADFSAHAPFQLSIATYRFTFLRSQASTIFVGSIAALSNCSSKIFPSLPIRKLIRRAALYLSR